MNEHKHEFIAIELYTNKIVCQCGMYAEDYFERKFENGEDLITFLTSRILDGDKL